MLVWYDIYTVVKYETVIRKLNTATLFLFIVAVVIGLISLGVFSVFLPPFIVFPFLQYLIILLIGVELFMSIYVYFKDKNIQTSKYFFVYTLVGIILFFLGNVCFLNNNIVLYCR